MLSFCPSCHLQFNSELHEACPQCGPVLFGMNNNDDSDPGPGQPHSPLAFMFMGTNQFSGNGPILDNPMSHPQWSNNDNPFAFTQAGSPPPIVNIAGLLTGSGSVSPQSLLPTNSSRPATPPAPAITNPSQTPSFRCDLCQKGYTTPSNLYRHLRVHSRSSHSGISHSEKQIFQCELCGTTFNQAGNLKAHLRGHTQTSAYKCICNFGTKNNSTLTKHQQKCVPFNQYLRTRAASSSLTQTHPFPVAGCIFPEVPSPAGKQNSIFLAPIPHSRPGSPNTQTPRCCICNRPIADFFNLICAECDLSPSQSESK